jgi:hypothetical protein
MQDWPQKLRQHWQCHWLHDGDDAAETSATEDIRMAFGKEAPGNEEICRAILHLSGPKAKQDRCPTLRQLIITIAVLRKQAREAGAPDADDCACCQGSGWVAVAPELPATGYTAAQWAESYRCAAPCTCAVGARNLARCKPYAGWRDDPARLDNVRRLGRLGAQQWQHRRRHDNAQEPPAKARNGQVHTGTRVDGARPF